MNLSFFSFLILFIPELSAHVGYYKYLKPDAFLDIAAILTASAFAGSILFNFIFIAVRAVEIFTHRFGKLWIYGAPGFASFLIFLEIPLRTFGEISKDSSFIFIFAGFLITSIVILLFIAPVFTGMNATLLFLGAVFSRLLMLPFESMTENIFSQDYLTFQIYLITGVMIFYLLFQMRYRYHLTPYYERFRVPYFIIVIAIILWLILIFASWFQFNQDSHLFKLLEVGEEYIIKARDELGNFPINSLLLVFTFWIFLAIFTNLNYRSRIRKKNTFKFSLLIFLFTFCLFLYSSLRLSRSFPGNENISEMVFKRTVSLELLHFAGLLMDLDGDSNSLWPGHDPDDGNACIRADYKCIPALKKSFNMSGRMEDRINGAKEKKNIIMITLRGKLAGSGRRVYLRSDSAERNLRALLHDVNGMEEFPGDAERSFISEFAEMGYRTICGGYTGQRGYMSLAKKTGLDSGCQIYAADDEADINQPQNKTFRSVVRSMGDMYRKYHEEYTFLWIHYDSDENQIISGDDLEGLDFIENSGRIILIMNPPYAEVQSSVFDERNDMSDFSLRRMIYRYLKYDPYDKSYHPGPIVIEKNTVSNTFVSHVYRWRRENRGLLPQRTAVPGKNGSLVITDHLLGIRYSDMPVDEGNSSGEKRDAISTERPDVQVDSIR